jgi:hypothetical protein
MLQSNLAWKIRNDPIPAVRPSPFPLPAAGAQDWSPARRSRDARARSAEGDPRRDDYPVSSDFTKRVEYIDFESFGQAFTQVVVILTPRQAAQAPRPRHRRGGRPSRGANTRATFLRDARRARRPGIWLARRGITFVRSRASAAGISSRPARPGRGKACRSKRACRSSTAGRRRTGRARTTR